VVLSSRNISDESGNYFFSHVLTTSPLVLVANHSCTLKRGSTLKEKINNCDMFIPGTHFEAKTELDALLNNLKSQIRIAGEVDDIALLRVLAIKSGSLVAIPEMGIINEIKTGEVRVIHKFPKIQQKFYAITRYKLKSNDHIKYLIDKMS
jgi:LysR family transcriptional activator of nhaA